MGSTPADLKRDPEYDPSHDELAELRALLLGQQIVELQALQKRLDDPNLRAEETSQILARPWRSPFIATADCSARFILSSSRR